MGREISIHCHSEEEECDSYCETLCHSVVRTGGMCDHVYPSTVGELKECIRDAAVAACKADEDKFSDEEDDKSKDEETEESSEECVCECTWDCVFYWTKILAQIEYDEARISIS